MSPSRARAAWRRVGALVVLSIALAAPALAETLGRTRVLMGTTFTIDADVADATRGSAAIDAAFDTVAALERSLSNWLADSELTRLNASAHAAPFACSPDLFAAIEAALSAAETTGGASDPTVEPLVRAWDLRGEGREPSAAERETARAAVGWRHVVLDRDAHTVHFERAGTALDLGGIGKGVALERAAAVLRAQGVERARLNFGGEVRAFGGGHAIAIAHPADRLAPAISLALDDGAVSTSGQSERGVTVKRRWHGHVLDPRTGAPVPTHATVTVVARDAAVSDGLDTGLLVMGRDGAERFARTHADVGVLWLERHGDRVRAWAWNLPTATAAPGASVDWMHAGAVPNP